MAHGISSKTKNLITGFMSILGWGDQKLLTLADCSVAYVKWVWWVSVHKNSHHNRHFLLQGYGPNGSWRLSSYLNTGRGPFTSGARHISRVVWEVCLITACALPVLWKRWLHLVSKTQFTKNMRWILTKIPDPSHKYGSEFPDWIYLYNEPNPNTLEVSRIWGRTWVLNSGVQECLCLEFFLHKLQQ